MWSVENNQYTGHLGLSLPQDDRLPWNPWSTTFQAAGVNENGQSWNPWSSMFFQDCTNNENRHAWNPWSESAYYETQNDENERRSQLFGESKNFSEVVSNNLNRIHQKPENFGSDTSMIFQNISNENLSKNPFPRRKNRKNRKRNRTLKMIVNNVELNSSRELWQEEYQGWNHQPVINWSRANSSARPLETNFYNPFKSTCFSKNGGKRYRFQNPTRDKFASASRNSEVASRPKVPRSNSESINFSNSRNNTGNSISLSSNKLNSSNKSTIMEKNRYPITSSANSKNITDALESSNEDITYLFTVDSSEANMVLEVDLASNKTNLVSNKSSKRAANLNQKKNAKYGQDITILEKNEVTESQTSRKRKLSNSNDKNSKRPSYQPECMTCKMRYDDVMSKSENMYISSSCSHIFCRPCISKDNNAKVCPACGVKFNLLRRLYL